LFGGELELGAPLLGEYPVELGGHRERGKVVSRPACGALVTSTSAGERRAFLRLINMSSPDRMVAYRRGPSHRYVPFPIRTQKLSRIFRGRVRIRGRVRPPISSSSVKRRGDGRSWGDGGLSQGHDAQIDTTFWIVGLTLPVP
jgi:hypothetical protein